MLGREALPVKTARIFKQYLLITAGCGMYALGFCWCCQPNYLNVGGFTGVAQVLNATFPVLPVGSVTLALNVPLFLLGWKFLGRQALAGSLYAVALSSLMIDGLNLYMDFQPMDPILACLYGGLLYGVAFGVMLRQGATTGGTELAARLLKLKMESLPIGNICLVIDLAVICGYALTFGGVQQALYSVVTLYISTFMMDRVVYGGSAAKMAYIISRRHEDITRELLAQDRGVTLLEGVGAYSGERTEVLLCAFSRSYVIPLKKLVQRIDPDAFVIVCDAHEILGEGFGVYEPGGL